MLGPKIDESVPFVTGRISSPPPLPVYSPPPLSVADADRGERPCPGDSARGGDAAFTPGAAKLGPDLGSSSITPEAAAPVRIAHEQSSEKQFAGGTGEAWCKAAFILQRIEISMF